MDDYRKLVIELVQAEPIIWDPTHRDYKNRDQRKQVWDSIDAQLKQPSGTHMKAKATWDMLTKSYSNALRRKLKRSGSGADNEKDWKFQKEMMFLLPAKQLRLSYGNHPNIEQDMDLRYCDHIDSRDSTELHAVASELDIAIEKDNPINLVTSPPQDSYSSTSESQDQIGLPRCRRRREETRGVNKCRGEEIQSDAEILNLLKQRQAEKSKESPRLNFFRSIMETVDSLDQYQFMNFQMDVIQALKKQKEKADQQRIKDEQPIQYTHSQSSGASTSTATYNPVYSPENSEYF
ncbi:uncharacterized protein LOC101858478 [Aplysia californica]|uniref:Uncharacterized protein LOC101858478 n=1 Tax=Aplysia californica TaxID=6500 RepID=A0ABM0JJ94_APLCA|nr:uncharacterized protein LOC101858478 [Aplysia californica]